MYEGEDENLANCTWLSPGLWYELTKEMDDARWAPLGLRNAARCLSRLAKSQRDMLVGSPTVVREGTFWCNAPIDLSAAKAKSTECLQCGILLCIQRPKS